MRTRVVHGQGGDVRLERRHNRQAQRLLVISPMVDAKARQVAEQLGIELYSDSDDVETL